LLFIFSHTTMTNFFIVIRRRQTRAGGGGSYSGAWDPRYLTPAVMHSGPYRAPSLVIARSATSRGQLFGRPCATLHEAYEMITTEARDHIENPRFVYSIFRIEDPATLPEIPLTRDEIQDLLVKEDEEEEVMASSAEAAETEGDASDEEAEVGAEDEEGEAGAAAGGGGAEEEHLMKRVVWIVDLTYQRNPKVWGWSRKRKWVLRQLKSGYYMKLAHNTAPIGPFLTNGLEATFINKKDEESWTPVDPKVLLERQQKLKEEAYQAKLAKVAKAKADAKRRKEIALLTKRLKFMEEQRLILGDELLPIIRDLQAQITHLSKAI
jgi:hypothetical protein